MKTLRFINVMNKFEKIMSNNKLSLMDCYGAVMLLKLSRAYTGSGKKSESISLIDVNSILESCIEEHGSCTMEVVASYITNEYNWCSTRRLSKEDKTLDEAESKIVEKVVNDIDSAILNGSRVIRLSDILNDYKEEVKL